MIEQFSTLIILEAKLETVAIVQCRNPKRLNTLISGFHDPIAIMHPTPTSGLWPYIIVKGCTVEKRNSGFVAVAVSARFETKTLKQEF